MRKCLGLLFAILIMVGGFSATSRADATMAGSGQSYVPGYLSDVRGERADPSVEFVIMPLSTTTAKNPLYDRIFTNKLKRDFIRNYRNTFGYTEYEQIQSASNQFGNVVSDLSNRFVPIDTYISKQNQFGHYMLNALAEYHIDNYFKHSQSLRTVYKVQKKLSHVQYKTKTGGKVNLQYQLASNTAILTYKKPNEKFHKELDFQVGGQANTVLRLGYDVSHRVNLQTDIQFEDAIVSVIATRQMRDNLSTNVTLQTIAKSQDVNTPPQDRLLFGLSWND